MLINEIPLEKKDYFKLVENNNINRDKNRDQNHNKNNDLGDYKPKISKTKKLVLKKDKLEELGKLTIGHAVFLPSVGDNYPTKIMVGKELYVGSNSISPDKYIKYLRFTECEISQLHWNTYKEYIGMKIPLNNTLVNDIVFPNPDYDKKQTDNKNTGLYRKIQT